MKLSTVVQQFRVISPFARGQLWVLPIMAVVGLFTSIVESLAISLVVLFLYAIIGPGAAAAGESGLLTDIFTAVRAVTDGSNAALGALIFGLAGIKVLLSLSYNLITASVKNSISERARNRIYGQYLDVSYDYIGTREQGELINVLARESWTVADAFYSFARMGTNICAFAVFGGILFAISWQITLIAVFGVAVSFGCLRLLSRPVQRLGKVTMEANEELVTQMVNTFQGMRAIRAYAQEHFRKKRFGLASREARDTLVRLEQIYALINPISEVLYLGLLAAIVLISITLAIPFASVLGAIALLYRLQPHLREFESNRLKLAQHGASLAAVEAVVSRKNKSYPPVGSRAFGGLREHIRFERVWFTYQGADGPSLRDASFVIPKGSTTAIIGASGAGKTSIVNLLLRLYEPTSGAVLVDGTCLDVFERTSWLARIAVAGQDVELIDNTIIENIRLARPDANRADIELAAKRAGIDRFIARLPNGFESWIGDRGLNLSGGQRQRIGLIRALIRRPELLILDEATSAVDGPLEREIRANIATAMTGLTIVIITHRLDTLSDVDHVICLEEGRIIDQGAPELILDRQARLPTGSAEIPSMEPSRA